TTSPASAKRPGKPDLEPGHTQKGLRPPSAPRPQLRRSHKAPPAQPHAYGDPRLRRSTPTASKGFAHGRFARPSSAPEQPEPRPPTRATPPAPKCTTHHDHRQQPYPPDSP